MLSGGDSMNQTELQPRVAPVLPKFIPCKNSSLFRNTRDGAEFYCPICCTWRRRSDYLANIYRTNEGANYIAQLITDVKTRHLGFNYRKMMKECPPEKAEEVSIKWSKRALGMILNDKDVCKFLIKSGIKPEDVLATRDIGEGLTKLAKEKLVVLKWR